MQSLSAAQLDLHTAPEQTSPPHDVTVGTGQLPLPSQLTAVVAIPDAHFAAPHEVVAGANTHAVPTPSQRLPQVPEAHATRPLRGAWFAGSVVHFPIDPARSQAWHEPPQAPSQQ